jgi:hypothetical protein
MMPAANSTRQYKWQVVLWGRCGLESLASCLMLWHVLRCGIEESNSTASEDLHETRSDLHSLRRRRPYVARRWSAAAKVPRARGSVDEANSIVGIAMLHVSDVDIRNVLTHAQNDLFDLCGDLCRPEREHRKVEPLRVSDGSRSRWPPVPIGHHPQRPCCAKQRNESVSHDPRKVSAGGRRSGPRRAGLSQWPSAK